MEDAITAREFCQQVGIAYSTLLNMIHRGKAPATFKVGNKRWIRLSAIERWISDQEKAAA